MLFQLAFHIFLAIEYFYSTSYKSQTFAQYGRLQLLKRVVIVIPFVTAALINYWFFLRSGSNPAAGARWLFNADTIITGVFLPVVEGLFGSLSLSGIYGNIYNKITIGACTANLLMLAVLITLVSLIFFRRRSILQILKTDIIFRVALTSFGVYIFFWLAFSVKQSAVSGEDRLFLPVSILMFPYLLRWGIKGVDKIRYIYLGLVFVSVVYGLGTFYYRINLYAIKGAVLSQNKDLNGFKIYSSNQTDESSLGQISAFIRQRYSHHFVVIPTADRAFQLEIKNRLIVGQAPGNAGFKPVNYVVLVEEGRDLPPKGTLKRFASGRFSLYN